MTDDLVTLEPVSPHCLMDTLDDSNYTCLHCVCFDVCLDFVIEWTQLPFSEPPLEPEG